MVGYIEDLEFISVLEYLKGVSMRNTSMSSSNNAGNLQPEDENIQKFDTVEGRNLLKIPNPVGYLQELCVKKGFERPVYGVLNQVGPAHEPTFSTFCRVQYHYRVVTSKSKKKGKEMAARELIMCLKTAIDEQPKTENETVQIVATEIEAEMRSPISKPVRTINYVGFLQEFCVRKHLTPPYYITEETTKPPNNPSFYVFCEIGPYREVGMASNKKSAKQLAAKKVLELLNIS